MGRMKDYLMFLEEKGYVEWNDHTEVYDHLVSDIYAPHIMRQYENHNTSTQETPNDR